ncbi:RNA polymerase sigma factor FliA [Parapusillimonas granuli]|uniref:RNA polymerase sigma factor FliA n=1 Tax=Parapusillimonas granuli TaxID=380911 RepID=A0A853GAD4_9BURK|nr:RNA polymerase sigma factor FliA [Parapusillimonas granuli]MBB5213365.1 RNA polymerase sigma factor for flagellar operon FliA [Parapusillimonas granuli]MEB2398465.1 RNA polymerase sigma factor FliA [Alcaligenaceae bacterium]NYT51860.1 RNA polymerase sigma factor FliA [Parapusillimonas granuli]
MPRTPSTEDRLVGQYAPLVRRLALQLVARLPASVEVDDLLQAGMMGLLDAVRRYQETAEAQFETYAITRIRGAMLDELRSQDWLPRSVRSKSKSIEQAIHALSHRLLRPATEAEIAEELGMTLAEYQALLEEARGVQVIHYEDLVRQTGDGADPLEGRVAQDADAQAPRWSNPLDRLMSQALRSALVAAIGNLPEREKLLLSLQFEQDLNQKEIAAVLGVTEGRVSQIRSQAVARIRAALADSHWQDSPGEEAMHLLL